MLIDSIVIQRAICIVIVQTLAYLILLLINVKLLVKRVVKLNYLDLRKWMVTTIKMNLDKYEKFLASKRVTKELFTSKKIQLETNVADLQNELVTLDEALDVMNTVGVLAQEEFKVVFEKLVTQVLQYVFGDNYSFEMDSAISRNQPEILMYVVIGGRKHLFKDDELGYGVVDIVSFVLRLACWAIKYPRTRNCFVVDEPLRNLDRIHLVLFGDVLHQLSEMFNTQFIFVTQEEQVAAVADRSYHVDKVNETSIVTKIEKDSI